MSDIFYSRYWKKFKKTQICTSLLIIIAKQTIDWIFLLNCKWYLVLLHFIHIQCFTCHIIKALSMQIILGRQIYCWTWIWGIAHLALCLTIGCIRVSTGSGGGCVPTDVLQSAATFLPPSPLAASAPWSPATATSSSARVQVGFNLWWQQLYWAMNTMNSPAPTHLLLHRGTSNHQIHQLFVIYLVILNILFRM